MLKGQDILVLLKLLDAPMSWTMRSLGRSLDLDPAGVHRALGRLEEARLVDADRERVDRSNEVLENIERLGLHLGSESQPGMLYGITRRTREILAMKVPVATKPLP